MENIFSLPNIMDHFLLNNDELSNSKMILFERTQCIISGGNYRKTFNNSP